MFLFIQTNTSANNLTISSSHFQSKNSLLAKILVLNK